MMVEETTGAPGAVGTTQKPVAPKAAESPAGAPQSSPDATEGTPETQGTAKPIPLNIEGIENIIGEGFPIGSCVLLITPPMIEANLFCMEFIYRGILNKEPGMIITMDHSPEDMKIKALKYGWNMSRGEQAKILKWVDGYSINANKDVKSTDTIKRISGSIALSDLTIGMSQIQREYHQVSDHYRFIFDSLSTLFIYNDATTIYRFLRVIVSKLRASGGVGFFTLGEKMHDQQIEMTLRHMMDGTMELTDDLTLRAQSLPLPIPRKEGKLELTSRGFKVVG